MMKLTRTFSFEAGHFLPDYKGKCSRQHGHSYHGIVTVSGPVNEETGMVIDFSLLKCALSEVVDQLDHYNLNDIIPIPTAENTAKFIYDTLRDKINVKIEKIELWETETSSAIYSGEDNDES